MKLVKNYAKKVYKKAPKKKLIKKATTFGLKQVLGGPAFDLISGIYKNNRAKVGKFVGSYAYDNFFRSEFARNKLNSIPIAIISMLVRVLINNLLISNLKTDYIKLNFFLSIVVTVFVTLLSPWIYRSVEVHKEGFFSITDRFISGLLGDSPLEYLEQIKNKILFSLGVLIMIVLNFVEINSRYVQEIIFHSLITGILSNLIENYVLTNKVSKCHYGMTRLEPVTPLYITPYNLVRSKFKMVRVCNTKNIEIMTKPLKANIVSPPFSESSIKSNLAYVVINDYTN